MTDTYIVGGFVRDLLKYLNQSEFDGKGIVQLKIPKAEAPRDLDYVVIGSNEAEMMLSESGVERVGKDFPVFLKKSMPGHLPKIEMCEYALGRKESSTGDKTNDFEIDINPNITIIEDLGRRDTRINSMAIEVSGLKFLNANEDYLIYEVDLNKVVDPFNGMEDLKNKVLQHITIDDKTAFFEDPLRVLRMARFSARFPDFTIAADTVSIIQAMVNEGKVSTLKKERVWIEFEKALKTKRPSKFFDALDKFGVLDDLFPELKNLQGKKHNPKQHYEGDCYEHAQLVIDETAKLLQDKNITVNKYLPIMIGAFYHDIGKGFVSEDLHTIGKYHGHDSSKLKINLTDNLLELFKLDKRLEKTDLTSIINYIIKSRSSNLNRYKKIIIDSIDTHQTIHTFEKLNTKTIYDFFKQYCSKPSEIEQFTNLLYVAYGDSLGRYATVNIDTNLEFKRIIETNEDSLIVQETNELCMEEKYKYILDMLNIFHSAQKECDINIEENINNIRKRINLGSLTERELKKLSKKNINPDNKSDAMKSLIYTSMETDKINIKNFVVKKLESHKKLVKMNKVIENPKSISNIAKV